MASGLNLRFAAGGRTCATSAKCSISRARRSIRRKASLTKRRLWYHDFPLDPERHVDGPSSLCIGHRDRLGHGVREAPAVLTSFETQACAVAMRVLRPHLRR